MPHGKLRSDRLLPSRRGEFAEAVEWYDERRPGLGQEFEADVYAAADTLAAHPNAWTRWPGLRDVRVFPMDRFPFLIPYALVKEGVLILAVAHAKRRPGYWRSRRPASA
ncbi:MAG: type II toxin-antitoxin system RelE/ParE family toxin [Deltaproteobacteria bacterium]|nr:type II toxin-antitoxin system RelE/ParE family toxin [Deltaproteobacteria bacterium]